MPYTETWDLFEEDFELISDIKKSDFSQEELDNITVEIRGQLDLALWDTLYN